MGLKAARTKAYADYMAKLQKVEPGEAIARIDSTNTARKLQQSYGPAVSGTARADSRKADKVGREINNLRGEYNTKLGDYNTKVEILKMRLAGQDATAKVAELTAPMQARSNAIAAELDALKAAQAKAAGFRGPFSKPLDPTPEMKALQSEYSTLQNRISGFGTNYKPLPATYPSGAGLDQIEDAMRTMGFASGALQGKMKGGDTTVAPPTSAAPKSSGLGLSGSPSPVPGMGSVNKGLLGTSLGTANASPPSIGTLSLKGLTPDHSDPSTMVSDPSSKLGGLQSVIDKYGALANKISTEVTRGAKRQAVTGARSPASGLLSAELAGNQPGMIRAGLA